MVQEDAAPAAGERVGASYRDPAGFIFRRDGELFRQINHAGRADFEQFESGGLYESLLSSRLIVSHERADVPFAEAGTGWKVLRPAVVPFISYPYEWCFSQLKDAALTTLAIQKRAIQHGMSLKDASAYNIQFVDGRPTLIDTLSFERYAEGEPWVAYGQFCRHFLAPLALMALRDIRLGGLLATNLDGVPLDLAAGLLPVTSRLRLSLLIHLHLHARMHRRHAGERSKPASSRKLGRTQLLGILDSLESAVGALHWKPAGTEWADYYQDTNYSDDAMESKRTLVSEFIRAVAPRSVWDLGANTGRFSRLASEAGVPTVAFDIDPAAVETNWLNVRKQGERNLLPLLGDLTNPSAAIGWNHAERMSLAERGPADLALALALIHHLAVSANVPLGHIARFLHRIARNLVIEFVPKSDSQVSRLLVVRRDIFGDYTQEGFESQFAPWFETLRRQPLPNSSRMLYLMRRRDPV